MNMDKVNKNNMYELEGGTIVKKTKTPFAASGMRISGHKEITKMENKPAVIDTMSNMEIRATVQNADLRKKLRVDRARKEYMRETGPKHGSAIEDAN